MLLNSTEYAPILVLDHFLRFFKYIEENEIEGYESFSGGFANIFLSSDGNVNATMNLITLCWADDNTIKSNAKEFINLLINSNKIFPKDARKDLEYLKKVVHQRVQEQQINDLLSK